MVKKKADPIQGTDITTLPLGSIKESKDFRLRLAMKDIDALAKDIRERGLICPLFVQPLEKGIYELICGYRRLAALRAMGAKESRAKVFAGLTRDQALSLAVAENVQRSDLTPLEKALLCKRLQDEGRTRKEIGAIVFPTIKGEGIERNVQNYLTVAKCEESIQEALADEKISFSIALVLAETLRGQGSEDVFTLGPKMPKILGFLSRDGVSVRGAREYLEGLLTKGEDKRPGKKEKRKWEPVVWKEGKRGWKLEIKFREGKVEEKILVKIEKEIEKALERIKEYRKAVG
jgi:ParB/RepB/Spo0J family partition protein